MSSEETTAGQTYPASAGSGLFDFPDPRKTSPYRDGVEARKRGEDAYMCPWEMDSAPGRLWLQGWHSDPNDRVERLPTREG